MAFVRLSAHHVAVAAAMALMACTVVNASAASDGAAIGPDPSGRTVVVIADAAQARRARGCTPIHRVEIRGVILIDEDALREAVAPLAVSCVSNEAVQSMVKAINSIYADRGFITTQAYLPEQDLASSRILRLTIIAGRIDRVVYRETREDEPLGKAWAKVREAGGPWELLTGVSGLIDRIDDALDRFEVLARGLDPDPKLWTSFLAEPGEIVEIDRVQHGVDQLNRVASHRAAVKLEPGAQPATSVIAVESTAGDSFRVNAGYELNGSDLNGTGNTVPARLRLDVAKDNLVGISDAWRASYASGLDSNEVRVGFSAPFRRFLISLDAGYSESLAEVAPGVEMFTRDGNASASLSYLLHRDRSRQTNLEASLSWRTGERFIEGVSLAPQVAAPVRIGVSESRAFGDTLKVSYGAGVSKGLNAFGATDDAAAIEPTAPRAQFAKVDGQVGFAKTIEGIGVARLDVNAQWSERPLYSDDQLVLGSVSTVRGFTNSAQRADRGVVARAEFQPELQLASWLGDARKRVTFLDEALSGLQPYLFSDYGAGRDLANRETLERASIGAGLRYRHGRINLDVSVGEPVFRSGGTKVKAWQAPEAYLTLSVRLL